MQILHDEIAKRQALIAKRDELTNLIETKKAEIVAAETELAGIDANKLTAEIAELNDILNKLNPTAVETPPDVQ
jgi:uncharacterized protein YPO0396